VLVRQGNIKFPCAQLNESLHALDLYWQQAKTNPNVPITILVVIDNAPEIRPHKIKKLKIKVMAFIFCSLIVGNFFSIIS